MCVCFCLYIYIHTQEQSSGCRMEGWFPGNQFSLSSPGIISLCPVLKIILLRLSTHPLWKNWNWKNLNYIHLLLNLSQENHLWSTIFFNFLPDLGNFRFSEPIQLTSMNKSKQANWHILIDSFKNHCLVYQLCSVCSACATPLELEQYK